MLKDVFGINMLYATKPGAAKDWYMDHNPKSDPRTDDSTGEVIGQGTSTLLRIRDHQVRMNVFAEAKSAYDMGKIEYNQHILETRGHMLLPNDWKNVEITAYIKVTKAINNNENGGAHFEWYCRGGPKHTGPSRTRCNNSNCVTCEGTSYHAKIYDKHGDEGKVKFEKELEHTTGYYYGDKKKVTGQLKDRWIGYKAVFHNSIKDGKEIVKLEQ